MTTYVIGDLHGCLSPLKRLLKKIKFDPTKDRLWFVGDLVNRGPESLETLRYVKALGKSAITVLGNHDLHLLAVVHGVRSNSGKDTLQDILTAPDRDELCHWLSRRPVLHTDGKLGYTLVHAGIHPQWSLKRAQNLADEVKYTLRHELEDFLWHMYGDTPAGWSKTLTGRKRIRFAVNAFTRMRYCYDNGDLNFDFNGPPKNASEDLYPWYAVPGRKKLKTRIVFGHWSSHPSMSHEHVVPTDKGCLWGGCLSAFAIESKKSYSVKCS